MAPLFRCHDAQLVGLGGLEPPASPLSGVRSNHLSYRPGAGVRMSGCVNACRVNLAWHHCVSCVGARDRHLLTLKEVIQPHLPIRLPCYDFTPVIDHTVASAPQSFDRLSYLLLVQPTPMV